jgi:hypothetical protein
MIATSVSFTRPLVVKQASSQKHRTVVMALAPKQEESCPALDRRRSVVELNFIFYFIYFFTICCNKPKLKLTLWNAVDLFTFAAWSSL